MSYREEIEQKFKAAQLNSGHAVTEEAIDATDPNAQIDRAIYEIDAVMNGYDLATATHVPPFTPEHMVKMREIIKKLYARPAL